MRPRTLPTAQFISKAERAVGIADFMLGVLSKYLTGDAREGAATITQFERLRDRYSLIYDVDQKVGYSRRNPLSAGSLK